MSVVRPDGHDPVADEAADRPGDEGTILVMVLVMMVIGSLIVLPLMVYTISVFRAGGVQADKAEAVELARGGTWVALSNEADLFDKCDGVSPLSGALGPDVNTICTVVDDSRLRPAAEIPYHVVSTQSDVGLPAPITAQPTVVTHSPNSTTPDPNDWDKWIDGPDWSNAPSANTVWLPELPVRSTNGGGPRDTTLSFDPTCRIFFPGTFQNPITIQGPTYFTSGVYYFTKPITLEKGADVVVGNGTELGCTTDFEAVADAVNVPNPLNIGGLGGTFVFGGDARLVIDDQNGPGTSIKLTMNQRYVAPEDTSVLASSNVSIVSVNGTHAPLFGAEVLGDDLVVNGVIHVPASTVGTGDPISPRAVDSGFTPSKLTAKPLTPDAPTVLSADDYQRPSPTPSPGRLTVTWDIPNENGSPITSYVATDLTTGLSCSPMTPTLPDTSLQTSCTITGIAHASGDNANVVVTATNALGVSLPSATFAGPQVDLSGGSPSPIINPPSAPQNPTISDVYSDGNRISWDPPLDDGGGPITGYRVTATPTLPGPPVVTCEAWWDETSCMLRASDGFVGNGSTTYTIEVVAVQAESPPYQEYLSPPATILPVPTPTWFNGSIAAPFQTPTPYNGIRVPDPIVGLTTTTSTPTEVLIAGYISVPQGRIEIGATDPSATEVELIGGVVAGDIWVDPAGVPSVLRVELDNPIAQKRVRIETSVTGKHHAKSVAIVQVNRSGSLAVNAWFVQ